MRELALHVLDVLRNTVDAGALHVTLRIEEDIPADRLTITVEDDGRGMDAETAARAADPFFTTRKTRHVGLGLPLLAGAAERAGGALHIRSQPGQGVRVEGTFQLSHPDRQPLGDIATTLLAFLLSDGAPNLGYHHCVRSAPHGDWHHFEFDTAVIRAELGDLPVTHPAVVQWLAEFLAEGESELNG
jgi:anti-sigma regulatory factor (Ser/Thr protein kinase)